jgi:hypothetical protein
MSRNIIFIVMYHRHKLLDLAFLYIGIFFGPVIYRLVTKVKIESRIFQTLD